MTSCDDVQSRLSALLDKELPADVQHETLAHLKSCEACSKEWHDLQSVDSKLNELLTVDNIAERVAAVQDAADHGTVVATDPGIKHWRWTAIIAAVAASILILFYAFRGPQQDGLPGADPETVVAQLVRATGPIQLQPPDSDDWESIEATESFAIVKGSRLRTGASVLCEVKTAESAKLRLNESSELLVHDVGDLELVSGQLWCLAAEQVGLDISIAVQNDAMNKKATISCPSKSEFQCVAGKSFAACDSISSTNPATVWTMGSFTCPVAPGETVSIDATEKVERKSEPNTASKVWQLPLLAVGSRGDGELMQSLDFLLAPIGKSKARHLNEEQIRSLGPKGAVPLLAFVKSNSSPDKLSMRRTAIYIAADLADEGAITILQEIEADPDAFISSQATRGLKRIAEEAK